MGFYSLCRVLPGFPYTLMKFCDFHGSSLIFIDVYWFLSIFVDLPREMIVVYRESAGSTLPHYLAEVPVSEDFGREISGWGMQKNIFPTFAWNLSRNVTFFALKRQITFAFFKKSKNGLNFAFLSRVFPFWIFLEQNTAFSPTIGKKPSRFTKNPWVK